MKILSMRQMSILKKYIHFKRNITKQFKDTIICWMPNRQSKYCSLSFMEEWRTDW